MTELPRVVHDVVASHALAVTVADRVIKIPVKRPVGNQARHCLDLCTPPTQLGDTVLGQPGGIVRSERRTPNRDFINIPIPIRLGTISKDESIHHCRGAPGGHHGRGGLIEFPVNV